MERVDVSVLSLPRARAAAATGQPAPVRAEDTTVKVQRDALSEEWRARFVEKYGTRSLF